MCYNRPRPGPSDGRHHHANDNATDIMKLAPFIIANLDQIIIERDVLAAQTHAPERNMTSQALREHAREILLAVAKDIGSGNEAGQETTAAVCGALRRLGVFDLPQLAAEHRALKMSVLKPWMAHVTQAGAQELADMMRFNEALDQALAESMRMYSDGIARSRDTFLGILGHDLRTPLGAISMAADYLSLPNLPEEKRLQAVGRIKSSTATMNAMIRDLLEYTKTRLEHGIPLAPRASDMGRICENALDAVRTAHPYCTFDFRTSGNLAGLFDAARLQQAIINLLNNAVQYCARGKPVLFTACEESEAVCIEVKHHGTRIPCEVLQIFLDPAMQVAPDARSTTSLGLGLFIAREIIVTHGGTIRVASNDAEETVFTVLLRKTGILAGA
ncbi:MAG: putative two-component sensor histidine kinase [Noviherbaspirillum sp.]|nr:putative two-component sensor histidine kinase [Noviherbaspirillum sp.]